MRNKVNIALIASIMLGMPIFTITNTPATVIHANANVKVEGIDGGSIQIVMPESNKDVDVLRSDKEDGKYVKIGTIQKGKTTFIDSGGDGDLGDAVWYYKIDNTIASAKAGNRNTTFGTDTDAINYVKMQLSSQNKDIILYYEGYTKGLDNRLLEECFTSPNREANIKVETKYQGKRNKKDLVMIRYMVEYDMTPQQQEEIKAKKDEILKGLDVMTNAEKLEKIYTYIAGHVIESDTGDTAYDALIKNQATSQGVAKAICDLFTEVGLECAIVNNDAGYFNVVKMADGLWYDVDAFREIKSINAYEYNRYDYLLTPRLKEHQIDQYKNQIANERWRFSKVSPQNVIAMTEEDGLIIKWDRVPHATGYKVQRSDSKDGAYSDVITYDGQPQEQRGWTKSNFIVDCSAEAGKTYYYRVKAYADYGKERDEGSFSDPQRVTYYGQLNLGINTSSVQPLLNWNEVDGASGYRIFRKEAGKDEECIAQVGRSGFVDTGAQVNVNYAYRVQVVRDSTSGDMYEYFSNYATTYGIKDISNTDDGLAVKWQAKDSEERYRLYRFDNNTQEFKLIAITEPEQDSYIDQDAEVGKRYIYRLAPFKETKNGRDINEKSVARSGIYLATTQIAGTTINDIPIVQWVRVEGANTYEVFVNGQLYQELGCAETQLILSKEKGKSVEVSVRAKTLTGNISAVSNTIRIG